jgi:hypothetical protein
MVATPPEEPPNPSTGPSAKGRFLPEQAANVMSMAKMQSARFLIVVPS